MESGFTLEVKSAVVDHTTHTQVNVTIVITQTEGSKTKEVTLKVTGLTATVPTFDSEKAKFTKTVETTTPLTEASVAVGTITSGATGDANLTALQAFATVPTPATGFTINVKSAVVNSTTKSQVDVTIEVAETATPANKADVTFSVTGLALSTLEKQKALFVDTAKKGEGTDAAAAALTITSAETPAAKQTALEAIATNLPTLAEGFTYEVKTAVVDSAKTSITVTVTITQAAAPSGSNTIEATLSITGFTAPSGSTN